MPLLFTVIRGTPRTGGADDLLVPTIGNISQFPLQIQVLPEINLTLSVRLVNLSLLGSLRVTTGEDIDLILDEILVEEQVFGEIIFEEAPPDETIYTPSLVNISEVNGSEDLELVEAPPDEYLYTPSVPTSTVASEGIILQQDATDTSEDSDPIVGAVVVGHTVV